MISYYNYPCYKSVIYILSLFTILNASDRIVITEILKDPAGPETECPGGKCHEFIEFLNLGADTFYIENLFLSDGITVDSVIPWQNSLQGHESCCFNREYLIPGQFALILDRDYAEASSGSHFIVEDSTVILTVDVSSLAGGLTATKGVFLYKGTQDSIENSLAAVLDQDQILSLENRIYHTQPANIYEGYSCVPANILFEPHLYIPCPESLSLGMYEKMEEKWICGYKLNTTDLTSSTVVCSIGVLKAGKNSPENASWIIRIAESQTSIDSGMFSPSSKYPVYLHVDLPKDSVIYEFIVEDDSNISEIAIDISTVWLPVSPIKINEIFSRSTPHIPEWVEIVNVSTMPVNLKNWQFGPPDAPDTIAAANLFIKPGEFLVLTKDRNLLSEVYSIGVTAVEPLHWPSLDNYRDTIVLINSIDNFACERVYYDYKWFDKWENQSLERVSTDIAGTEKEAWVLSEKLSPGQPNAGILWRSVDKPDIHIGPIPFTPNRDGKNDSLSIRLKLPASYKAKIEIFGFNGRKLYDIPEILSDKYTWNGRTEDGINAPVGPFFVVATFEKNGTKICIRKKGILWR